MFEQTFKNLEDILRKEAGCASELDYTEQTSWLLFLKYSEPDPEPPKAKLVIRLADGKERAFQHISATTFWSVDGKPVSAQQFIKDLFGQLPDLFRDEDELRAIWSQPNTRRKLVEGLAERGFTGEALDGVRRATDS